MTKEELIEGLRNSDRFNTTFDLIIRADPDIEWAQSDIIELVNIAASNFQVKGTLSYENNSLVRDYFKGVLQNYRGKIGGNVRKAYEATCLINNSDVIDFLHNEKERCAEAYSDFNWRSDDPPVDFSLFDGLYHANSVSSSISYIKHKMIYSRAYGDSEFPEEQTEQWSDEYDKENGIYNDLFFDCSDIRCRTRHQNAYGPISFVFDEEKLLEKDVKIRITKTNPGSNEWRRMTVKDKYFTDKSELDDRANDDDDYDFRCDFGCHITLWDKSFIPLDSEILKFIIVEKSRDERHCHEVKEKIISELDHVGLQNVPVAIRNDSGITENITMAAPLDELWRIP